MYVRNEQTRILIKIIINGVHATHARTRGCEAWKHAWTEPEKARRAKQTVEREQKCDTRSTPQGFQSTNRSDCLLCVNY